MFNEIVNEFQTIRNQISQVEEDLLHLIKEYKENEEQRWNMVKNDLTEIKGTIEEIKRNNSEKYNNQKENLTKIQEKIENQENRMMIFDKQLKIFTSDFHHKINDTTMIVKHLLSSIDLSLNGIEKQSQIQEIDEINNKLEKTHNYSLFVSKRNYDSSYFENIIIKGSYTKLIEDAAYKGCEYLERILILSSPSYIGPYDFYDCKNLKKILIPCSVKTIEVAAFKGCVSLKEISIPPSVNIIKSFAFCDCKKLEYILIPSSVSSIGIAAFKGCESLEEIFIPNSVRYIEPYAFCECVKLFHVVLPNSLRSLRNHILCRCEALECITIPSSVQEIEKGAFSECLSLESLFFEANSSLNSIDYYAFFLCARLSNITIPSSIKTIHNWAFYGCHSLKQIMVPNSFKDQKFSPNIKILRYET